MCAVHLFQLIVYGKLRTLVASRESVSLVINCDSTSASLGQAGRGIPMKVLRDFFLTDRLK